MIWRAMARIKIDNNKWTWTRVYSFLGKTKNEGLNFIR
jgi:hypothetical protein